MIFSDNDQQKKCIVLAGGGSQRRCTAFNLHSIAPVRRDPRWDLVMLFLYARAYQNTRLDAVARGCLLKWNEQLLCMTTIIRDTPIKKFLVGTCQRGAEQETLTHTWRKKASDGLVAVSYMINFRTSKFLDLLISSHCGWHRAALFPEQGWQNWEITVEAAKFPPILCNISEKDHNRTVEVRIDLRLPKVSPYVSDKDFEAYTTNQIKVPFTVSMTPVAYEEIFPSSP